MDAEAEREFRDFVAARSGALFRSAYLLTGQREAAEDLLQTVLARVARRWRRIDGAPEAYVRRALHHEHISSWRRRRLRTAGTVPDLPAPGDHAATTNLRLSLAAALRTLTARQRAVVVLRYAEDLPESEVAAVLDVSVGTVRSTAFRALARLRASCPELAIPEEAPR
ncbi:MAG TPA: SigE family RNA polymerase sigma factor [Mycobacteriales bacterium]